MKKLIIDFPWRSLPPLGGFFIPTLDPEQTKQELALFARSHLMTCKLEDVIVDGKIGVLFTRLEKPPSRISIAQS